MRTAKRIGAEDTGLVPAGALFQRLAHNLRPGQQIIPQRTASRRAPSTSALPL